MKDSTPITCPKCFAEVPADAPGGLCPACVLEAAATVPTAATGGRPGSPPAVGEIAPHFPELEILELLGAGGMGAVYKARQPQLDRFVALKILSRELSADPAFVERFNREARVLGKLSHPHIVGVFDFGTAGPYCYLLMEYVDGVNLRQAMRAGGFTPSEALVLVQEICAALKFAHDEGILHRDIKPENVLIDSKGRVKIADFGIAKLVGEAAASDVTLTLQGSILGSPHYMAPEQIEKPGDVDQRADIYSLGVVLYEMLTGELPLGRFAPPSAKAAMDARIDAIVLRTLEKEREARFQSAEEVMTEVGAVVSNPGVARTAAAPVSSDHGGSARFSLAGAILTGLSLVGIIAGAYIGNEYRDFGLTRETGKILMVVMVVLSAMTGITGMIFGCVALGAIRRSGGVLGGLGGSIFAVVLWPLLLLGAFASFFISMPQPEGHGGSVSIKMVAMPVLGGALAIAAFFLVLGLRRWARGVTDKSGATRHPGLFLPVLGAIGVMIVGVAAIETIGRLSDGSHEDDRYAGQFAKLEREIPRAVESTGSDSTSDGRMREWRLREPEINLPFRVPAGEQVALSLVFQEDTTAPKTIWEQEISGPLDKPAILEVGTQLRFVNGPPGAIQELVVIWTAPDGGSLHSNRDLRGWVFDADFASKIDPAAVGHQQYVIASLDEDGSPPRSGTLTLVVTRQSSEDE